MGSTVILYLLSIGCLFKKGSGLLPENHPFSFKVSPITVFSAPLIGSSSFPHFKWKFTSMLQIRTQYIRNHHGP